MFENVSINMIMNDMHVAVQWYLHHLNTNHLLEAWQQGNTFSLHDWHTLIVLNANILVLFCLFHLFIKVHKASAFKIWIAQKREHLTHKPLSRNKTKLEAKIKGSGLLYEAYNFHRLAMYDNALDKFKQALQSSPNDINTYLVALKIISEMDEPNKQFIQFIKINIHQLHQKHPAVWQEIAKYGREKTPSLDQWGVAA